MAVAPTPAETYEAFMVPFRFGPWARTLIDRSNLQSGARLLDLACGTGIVARVAASRLHSDGRIVGIDMNPAMIEVAQRAAAAEGWLVGKVEALPFPDRSFDLVALQQGLQFFPHQAAALQECARVLAPGGTLAIGIWSPLEKQGNQQNFAEAIEHISGSASMHASYLRTHRAHCSPARGSATYRSKKSPSISRTTTPNRLLREWAKARRLGFRACTAGPIQNALNSPSLSNPRCATPSRATPMETGLSLPRRP